MGEGPLHCFLNWAEVLLFGGAVVLRPLLPLGSPLQPLCPAVLTTQCLPFCTHTCLLTTLSFPGTQQVSNRIRHFQPPPCHLRHAHLCTLQPKRTASLSHCMCWHHRSSAAQAVPPPAVPSAPRPSSSWYLHTRSLPSALTCPTPVGWAAPVPSWVGSPGACLVSLFSCASATRPR